MKECNNEIGKRGEITISQLIGGLLAVVVIAFIFNSGFRQSCLKLIGEKKSSSSSESSSTQQASSSQSDILKEMDYLKTFFEYLSRRGLTICHAYSDAWQGAISSGWPTPDDALRQVNARYTNDRTIPAMTSTLVDLKTIAGKINETGSDIQRSLAADCVGTISELMALVNQPRGSLITFNNSIERLESAATRINGQLGVY